MSYRTVTDISVQYSMTTPQHGRVHQNFLTFPTILLRGKHFTVFSMAGGNPDNTFSNDMAGTYLILQVTIILVPCFP